MKKIQMVDLQTQYEFIKDDVDNSVLEVMKNGTFINGPSVSEFQSNLESYLNVKHVIPCANGTDALQIALMSLELKPGDEIITSDFTFAATVEVIALLRLTPVLVDVDLDTFNIDCNKVVQAITSKTKAIIPVHLFGQVANMEKLISIAKTHNLFLIEDNAQGIGSTYEFSNNTKVKSGAIGDIGTTSFFPSKNLGCFGDGGAIFTNDDDLAHTIRGIVNHGMYKRYYHDVVGVNSRLDSLQAAVLQIKLPLLDSFCDARRKAARYYNNAFTSNSNIITPSTSSCGNNICDTCNCHVFHQYTLRITNGKRDELHQYLLDNNIPNAIYYPVPLHAQKAYKDERYNEADFTVTNQLIDEVISLPMHTELDEEQLAFITEKINAFVQ